MDDNFTPDSRLILVLFDIDRYAVKSLVQIVVKRQVVAFRLKETPVLINFTCYTDGFSRYLPAVLNAGIFLPVINVKKEMPMNLASKMTMPI